MKKVFCIIVSIFCLFLCNCDGHKIDDNEENQNYINNENANNNEAEKMNIINDSEDVIYNNSNKAECSPGGIITSYDFHTKETYSADCDEDELFYIVYTGDYWIDKNALEEKQNENDKTVKLRVYIYDENNHPKLGIDYSTDIVYECYFEDEIYKWRENGIEIKYHCYIIDLIDGSWQLRPTTINGKRIINSTRIDNVTSKAVSVIKYSWLYKPDICVDISNGDIYVRQAHKYFEKLNNVKWCSDEE